MRYNVSGVGQARFKVAALVDGSANGRKQLLFFDQTPKAFQVRMSPKPLRQRFIRQTRKFGFEVSKPLYDMGIVVAPQIRIEVTARYQKLSRTFKTAWIPLNHMKIVIGALTLPRHQGARSEYRYSGGRKIYEKLPEEPSTGSFRK